MAAEQAMLERRGRGPPGRQRCPPWVKARQRHRGLPFYQHHLIAMGLLLIWRHRENIQRLLAGTESKLGQKKK